MFYSNEPTHQNGTTIAAKKSFTDVCLNLVMLNFKFLFK